MPTKYDCYDSCNHCGGVNDIKVIDTAGGRMAECKTKCRSCGFKDYWAHGHFESSQEFEGKCKKYSFNRRIK